MARIYPDVAQLAPEDMKLLCDTFHRNNEIDVETSERLGVKRGLRNPDGTGVLAGLTNICDVIGYEKAEDGTIIPIDGRLMYRGIDLQKIVEEAVTKDRFLFEEVCWLLLFGDLPNRRDLRRFVEIIEAHRELPEGFAEKMIMDAPSPNIMNKIARSVLAMYSYDENAEDTSLENIIRQSVNLVAEMPTMMIYAYATKLHAYDRKSLFFHYPVKGLSTAEHILSIYRPDQTFTHEEAKLLDLCMVVHADHGGGNCSTFTDRVLSSSGTDTYSAIAAAVRCLKGPKHGGANLKVCDMIAFMKQEIGDWNDEAEIAACVRKLLAGEVFDRSGLVYGIGHAVYTKSDPRAVLLKEMARELAIEKGRLSEFEFMELIEKVAIETIYAVKGKGKTLCANVDFYSGFVYDLIGIPREIYTPLFAMARIVGWCAHRNEELNFEGRRIIRPAYRCVTDEKEYVAMADR